MEDVAQQAGYAKSTVSRYINASGYVSPRARVTIQRAIDDLDYHPNQIARELSTGRTHRVGVVVPYAKHHYISEVMRGLLDVAMTAQYELLFLPSQYLRSKELHYLRQLRGHEFDALIFTSHETPVSQIAKFRRDGQIILMEDASQYGLSSVYVDREPSYRAFFIWLQQHHPRKVALLFYRTTPASPTFRQTLKYFQRYCPGVSYQTFDGIGNYGDGQQVATQLAAGHFDCVVANNDDVAADLLREMPKLTTKVPMVVSQETQLAGDILQIPSICDHAYQLGRQLGRVATKRQQVKIAVPAKFERRGQE